MKVDLNKALQAKAVLIMGDEDVLRLKMLRDFMREAGLGEDDFDSETFIADERTPTEWVASASTIPFLSDRRTVIVRQLLRRDPDTSDGDAKAKKNLKNPLADLPDTGRVVLVADEEPGQDGDKKSRFTKIQTHWEKWVKEIGGTVIDCTIAEGTLSKEFTEEAKTWGKKLSRPAADLLVEMVGGSYSRGLGEVGKLALFIGDQEEIREEHVRQVVTATREWNMWGLIDAVRDRRVGEAVRQLRVLAGTNRKIEEAAFQSIFPQLTRYFRLLWQARICHEYGVQQPSHAPEKVQALFPKKPNLLSEKPGTLSRILPQAKKVSLSQITACLEEIAVADAELKGIRPSANSLDTLERLLMRLAEILAPAPALRS